MELVSNRTKYGMVAGGYATVLLITAAFLYRRHLVELQDPAAASGGMAAAGDMMLQFFIGFLFLIPTAFLILILAKSETLYTSYSRFLLGLSLSAPVSVIVVAFGENRVPPSLSWICFFRILLSPIVLVGLSMSRFAARFDRAKRLVSYALLAEGLTLVLAVGSFIGSLLFH